MYQRNEWLPTGVQTDVLAFVEHLYDIHCVTIERAKLLLDSPLSMPVIILMSMVSLPCRISVSTQGAYTIPTCTYSGFSDRIQAHIELLLQKPGHQLIEFTFKYGGHMHLAFVHLRFDGESMKVVGAVFGF